jgi:hypothetical protein
MQPPTFQEKSYSMPTTLRERLGAPELQDSLISDCQALVDQEIAEKGGVSGTAVKVAYKTVTGVAPGYYRGVLTAMVPRFVQTLEPFWADFTASGGSAFGDYLSKRGDEVSEAMLAVTDEMAEASGRAVIVKAYRTVRGGAGKHVQAALPRLGDLITKYAA